MKTLREVVTAEIKRKKTTHTQVFTAMGITEQAYYTMLRRNEPKPATLKNIADALNVKVEYLMKEMAYEEDVVEDSGVNWKKMYEDEKQKVVTLLQTINMLSMGKRRTVLQTVAMYQ